MRKISPSNRALAAMLGATLTLVALPGLAQVPATTPAAAPAPNFGGSLLQLFLSLAVVLALVVGALWLLKQITQRRGPTSNLLKVVAGTAVGPRERVVIVEVGSTWLVLGVAPGRVTPLAEVPRETPLAPRATTAAPPTP